MNYEIEIIEGLLDVSHEEVLNVLGRDTKIVDPRPDALPLRYRGPAERLLDLKTVIAAYSVRQFNIPRPKAFLGHQHFQIILSQIQDVIKMAPQGSFKTMYMSAAGSDSSVMRRIKSDLAEATGLQNDNDEGDLLIRIRPTPGLKHNWDVLVRITPRPLATRDWRVCNYEGALNGAVARALVHLTNPKRDDVFVNLCAGSGTLAIERAQDFRAQRVIAVENDRRVIACAEDNIVAGSVFSVVEILREDAGKTSLEAGIATALCADLPFGNLVGSHDDNTYLYPRVVKEAARIAAKGAKFVIISHEVTLLRQVLAENSEAWKLVDEKMITLSGLHPRIFVLERQ